MDNRSSRGIKGLPKNLKVSVGIILNLTPLPILFLFLFWSFEVLCGVIIPTTQLNYQQHNLIPTTQLHLMRYILVFKKKKYTLWGINKSTIFGII